MENRGHATLIRSGLEPQRSMKALCDVKVGMPLNPLSLVWWLRPQLVKEHVAYMARPLLNPQFHKIPAAKRLAPGASLSSPDHAFCRAVKTCRQTKQDRAMREGQPDKTRWDTLSGVYEHSKVARLRCWLWMRLLLRCSGRRIEIRSREENVVSLWINLQRFRAIFRLNGFNLAELVR